MCVLVQRDNHPSRRSDSAGCSHACSHVHWAPSSLSQPCPSEAASALCTSAATSPFHLREHLDKQEVSTFLYRMIHDAVHNAVLCTATAAARWRATNLQYCHVQELNPTPVYTLADSSSSSPCRHGAKCVQLSPSGRGALVDWMTAACSAVGCCNDVLFLGVALLDRWLAKAPATPHFSCSEVRV
jgi:hypothetical protein